MNNRLSRIYCIDHILPVLLSITRAAGQGVHPEFIRAVVAIAQAFGITENELRNGKLEG